MTCYIANHRKKLEALARRELDLARALQRGKSESVLESLAKEVRTARVRVIRVRKSLIAPRAENDDQLAMLQKEIDLCEATPIQDILTEIRNKGGSTTS